MSDTQQIRNLQLEQIDLGDNVRFGLDPSKVRALADSITEVGGIQEPVSVTALPGNRFKLIKGFYRCAAAALLNGEGAGLTIPAIVRDDVEGADLLKLQVTENVARAGMSPMDTAIAMKQLLDAGVPKIEVRRLFPRVGGRKGAVSQPANNSTVNLYLSLLDLPKGMQNKIHLGLVSATAGFDLARIADPERRAEVLAKAEELVQKALDAEDKDEEKFLKAEAKEQSQAAAESAAADQLAKLEESVTELQKLDKMLRQGLKDKRKALADAKKADHDPDDAASTKKWQEHVKAADADYTAAGTAIKQNSKELARSISKRDALKEKLAAPKKEKTEKATEKKAKAVGPKEIAKAAKATGGESTAAVPLKPAEMKQALRDIGGDKDARVAQVGGLFLELFLGTTTPKMLVGDLKKLLK